jgi:Amt family ammonium transporter
MTLEAELLRSLVEHSPDTFLVLDADGMIRLASGACHELLGYRPNELIGRLTADLVHPDDLATGASPPAQPSTDEARAVTVRWRRKDGTYLWVDSKTRVIRHGRDGAIRAVVAVVRDASERVQALTDVRRRETELRTVLDSSGDGIVVVDVNGRFTHFNSAGARILGMGAVDEPPSQWGRIYGLFETDRVTPIRVEALPLIRAVRGENVDQQELFIRNPAVPDGLFISVTACPIRDADGTISGAVASFRDVTRMRTLQEQLHQLAVTDMLTGIPNQRAFRARLAELIRDGARGRSFALVLCDIDHFKSVNDTIGHTGGDAAMVAFAQTLRRHVRQTDFVARYGGDEFAVIYTEVLEDRAAALAEELRLAVRTIVAPSALTASFGVCGYAPRFEGDAESMMRAVDLALYRAKAAGRDCVVAFAQSDEPKPR